MFNSAGSRFAGSLALKCQALHLTGLVEFIARFAGSDGECLERCQLRAHALDDFAPAGEPFGIGPRSDGLQPRLRLAASAASPTADFPTTVRMEHVS
jgi:hypothetical protein